VAIDAAVELDQRAVYFGGRRMTLPDQFANQERLGYHDDSRQNG
jgi:hypothetical protein